MPPHSVGGSELYTLALARGFSRRHSVFVFAGGGLSPSGYSVRKEEHAHFTTYWLSIAARRSPALKAAYDNPEIDELFRRVLEDVRPDVVHIHGIWGLSNNIPLVSHSFGCTVVFTLHDFWLMCPRGQRLRPTDLS